MAKFLSRLNLKKFHMKITVKFLELETAGLYRESFVIAWMRGKQLDYTEQYKFHSNNKPIVMNDEATRVSNFYSTKQVVWQAKTCEFKLIEKKGSTNLQEKILQSVTVDMSSYVNKTETIKIPFKQFGITLTVKMEIRE